jgi:hypothetical protein
MKLDLIHADTCYPDYWTGHHRPHIMVPVWHGISLKTLKRQLRDEIAQGTVMGSDDDARLLAADMIRPEEERQTVALTRAAYAAINRLKPAQKGARRLFLDLEQPDPERAGQWDDETVYAYFVFIRQE